MTEELFCPACCKRCQDKEGRSSCCKEPFELTDEEKAMTFSRPSGQDPTAYAYAKRRDKLSQYRGVTRYRNKWRAILNHRGRRFLLGDYDADITAAKVWDNACYYLEQALLVTIPRELNFPEDYQGKNPTRQWLRTSRLIRRLEMERDALGATFANKRQRT